MRTQLCEIAEIESYLLGHMQVTDRLVFRAKMIVDRNLCEKVTEQKKILQIVRQIARDQKRQELDVIYSRLLTEGNFSSQLRQIFK